MLYFIVSVNAGRKLATHLNVEQPRSKVVDAFLFLLHVPDDEVESVAREKALVSGVVDLLTSHVPHTELNLYVVL